MAAFHQRGGTSFFSSSSGLILTCMQLAGLTQGGRVQAKAHVSVFLRRSNRRGHSCCLCTLWSFASSHLLTALQAEGTTCTKRRAWTAVILHDTGLCAAERSVTLHCLQADQKQACPFCGGARTASLSASSAYTLPSRCERLSALNIGPKSRCVRMSRTCSHYRTRLWHARMTTQHACQ
jgi:hypothetical protein